MITEKRDSFFLTINQTFYKALLLRVFVGYGRSILTCGYLIGKAKEEELAKLTAELKKMGNTKPLYLTEDKIEELEKERFYYSLIFGSILLYGEDLGSIR